MSSSNCCFLTCIQISQEAGKVLWYSHLVKNFPQFVVIHIVEGFGIVNKAEVDVFLELSCFFDDPTDVGNLIPGSSAFSKFSLNIWKFTFHILAIKCSKSFKPGFNSTWTENFQMFKLDLKRQRNQGSNCRHLLDHQKSKRVPENIYFCFIDYAKAFDCMDHNKLWKILQEMGI